jgi:DNA polymerase (family 10)
MIGALLRRYAGVIAIQGANRFKVRAYRRAAETIEAAHDNVAQLLGRGDDLTELPGIGKAIAAVIAEIVQRGELIRLDQGAADLAPGILELAQKPGLDPKKILRVYKKLRIGSLEELRQKLDAGDVRDLLGSRLDFQLRQALDHRPRMLLWAAEKLIPGLKIYLTSVCGAVRVETIGSMRRKKDTIADIGFLVTGKTGSNIFRRFATFGAVQSWESLGKHEALFRLSEGKSVKLVWTPEQSWGLSWLLHTGAVDHVETLKKRAARLKVRLTRPGLGKRAADEASVYRALGLAPIEPELREGRGEIEAAAADKLPRLIEIGDLKGDLHMHTTASDGANSIDEMAQAALDRGYEYIAITDHSQSLKITNGLTEKRLLEQIRAIDQTNARLRGITVLKSAEVDILEDGRLDYSNAALKELDLTICSVHSKFALDSRRQTERIMRAMDNPYFNILGHATGRLLLHREGYLPDIEKLIAHAKARGCFFEINSSPNRLDLSDEHARMAKNIGVKIAVNTDAHSISELRFIAAGINQARRGWLEPKDVLNSYSLAKLKALLDRQAYLGGKAKQT